MPTRYRKRAPAYRARKRRVYRRKRVMRRGNKASKLIYRPTRALGAIVPDRYFTKLRYNYLGTYNLSAGIFNHLFSLNSIRDAGLGVDSTNAQGFTQLMALYNNFRVHMSKIRADFVSGATIGSGQVSTNFIIAPLTDGGSWSGLSPANAMSVPYSKHRMVSVNTGTPKTSITSSMSVKKLFGYKTIANEDGFVGSSSANPVLDPVWAIRTYNINGGTDAYNINVTIDYYVEFFDRAYSPSQ